MLNITNLLLINMLNKVEWARPWFFRDEFIPLFSTRIPDTENWLLIKHHKKMGWLHPSYFIHITKHMMLCTVGQVKARFVPGAILVCLVIGRSFGRVSTINDHQCQVHTINISNLPNIRGCLECSTCRHSSGIKTCIASRVIRSLTGFSVYL
jgi:hypothetical protein